MVELQRFWEKVQKKSGGCWTWLGAKNNQGYGNFNVGGKFERAHRIAYCLSIGEVPAGLFVLHHCDNPSCVNPKHLFLGTQKDNMQDCLKKGRFPVGERKKWVHV